MSKYAATGTNRSTFARGTGVDNVLLDSYWVRSSERATLRKHRAQRWKSHLPCQKLVKYCPIGIDRRRHIAPREGGTNRWFLPSCLFAVSSLIFNRHLLLLIKYYCNKISLRSLSVQWRMNIILQVATPKMYSFCIRYSIVSVVFKRCNFLYTD